LPSGGTLNRIPFHDPIAANGTAGKKTGRTTWASGYRLQW
jgi:hypothetical protein